MILGLDVSTSNVGYCIIDKKGQIVQINFVKLSKFKSLCSKAKVLKDALMELIIRYEITHIYIEEALQRFSFGRSSAGTITKLASFNGVTQYLCYDIFNVEPILLNVNNARKLLDIKTQSKKKAGKDVKTQVFEWVTDHLNYQWPTKILQAGPRKGTEIIIDQAYDMCDAWVIAKAGFVNLQKA